MEDFENITVVDNTDYIKQKYGQQVIAKIAEISTVQKATDAVGLVPHCLSDKDLYNQALLYLDDIADKTWFLQELPTINPTNTNDPRIKKFIGHFVPLLTRRGYTVDLEAVTVTKPDGTVIGQNQFLAEFMTTREGGVHADNKLEIQAYEYLRTKPTYPYTYKNMYGVDVTVNNDDEWLYAVVLDDEGYADTALINTILSLS